MALRELSPWPDTPAALASATAVLKQVLPDNLSDERVQRLGAVASALVEDYAPGAPQNVRDQCTEMVAGYMAQVTNNAFGAVVDDTVDLADIKLDNAYQHNHGMMFRNCGAAAMLSPWKVRRGGAIG